MHANCQASKPTKATSLHYHPIKFAYNWIPLLHDNGQVPNNLTSNKSHFSTLYSQNEIYECSTVTYPHTHTCPHTHTHTSTHTHPHTHTHTHTLHTHTHTLHTHTHTTHTHTHIAYTVHYTHWVQGWAETESCSSWSYKARSREGCQENGAAQRTSSEAIIIQTVCLGLRFRLYLYF